MKKKLLAVLLTVVMVVGLLPGAVLAADFNDTDGHWGKAAIDRWAEVGVLNGKSAGKFDPNGNMTRAEFAQMLTNMMGYTEKAENTFTDVPEDAWYTDAVLKLLAAGVLQGTGNGHANPLGLITREEAAVMLCRAFHLEPSAGATLSFADSANVAPWARDAVTALAERGMLNGVGGNAVAPKLNINRASVAVLVDNMIAEYVTTNKTITGEVNGIVLVVDDVNVTFSNATVSEPVILAPKAAGATVSFAGSTTADDVVVAADDVQISVGQGAKVETVTTEAANTKVTGSGDVGKVEVGEDAANATVTTPNTDVENNSTTPVTTPDGSIAAGQTGTTPAASTTTSSGSSGGGNRPAPQPKTYRVVFDATYGTIKLKENGGSDPTCWGGNNTCYGGENTAQGSADWISITVTDHTGALKLSDIAVTDNTFELLAPTTGGLVSAEGKGWYTTAQANGVEVTADTDLTTLADSEGTIVLYAIWKYGDNHGQTCYGGENSDSGYNTGTSGLPQKPTAGSGN